MAAKKLKILYIGFALLLLAACSNATGAETQNNREYNNHNETSSTPSTNYPHAISNEETAVETTPLATTPTPITLAITTPVATTPAETTPPTPTRPPLRVAAVPTYPFANRPIIGVTAHGDVSFAIMYDNSLWAWGCNERGQLGYGPTAQWSYRPVRIMENVISIATNGWRAYAVTTDGGLYTWGGSRYLGTNESRYHPVRVKENVIDVSIAESHAMALTADGGLWVWGSNTRGWGSPREHNPYPVQIMEDVVAIAAGRFSMAIKTDGSLWKWGDDGGRTRIEYPTHVKDNIVAITDQGGFITQYLALTGDGRVWMWEWDEPVLMDIPERIVAIDAGMFASWAISESGNLWTWLTAPSGQVGVFDMIASVLWDDFVEMYGIDALELDTSINPWLSPWWHVTGDTGRVFSEFVQDADRRAVAREILFSPRMIKENVIAVSDGGYHILLVTTNGDLWAMGDNFHGQLGDGTRQSSHPYFINISAIEWDASQPSPEFPIR
ncbi:MAG: hypothetical protein FWC71_08765 [Defluviitaleaceae bacterium]|nr:hypothetical protein [Defluviitaleaceae bacterium]